MAIKRCARINKRPFKRYVWGGYLKDDTASEFNDIILNLIDFQFRIENVYYVPVVEYRATKGQGGNLGEHHRTENALVPK